MLGEKLKGLIGETDKVDELIEVMTAIDELETTNASFQAEIEKLQADNANLREINGKLALQITTPVKEEEEEPEKSADEVIDEAFSFLDKEDE